MNFNEIVQKQAEAYAESAGYLDEDVIRAIKEAYIAGAEEVLYNMMAESEPELA